MDSALLQLTGLAAFIAVSHTLAGPDHYLPFIAMARVGGWSARRTIVVTALCGVGHVLSSVLIGFAAIALGWAVTAPVWIEEYRGVLAGWLLTGFGLAYATWGIHRAIRNRPHRHWHAHDDGTFHVHPHTHVGAHAHVHPQPLSPDHVHAAEPAASDRPARMTPWVLFTIFVFGPCEPLIPILMYPAATRSGWGVALVAVTFAAATIGTMLVVVMSGYWGLARLRFGAMERYSHALAGAALAGCGAAVSLGL